MKTAKSMTELTIEQMARVIGGDRKPSAPAGPSDQGSPEREVSTGHWSQTGK